MKTNSGKIHILFPGNDFESFSIDNNAITFENKNELLGVVLDSKLVVLNSKLSFEDIQV